MKKGNEEDRLVSEPNAADLLRQIVDTLDELHRYGIAHRDIRLGKIVVRNSRKEQAKFMVHGFEHAACLQLPKAFKTVKFPKMVSDNNSHSIAAMAPEIKAGLAHGLPTDIYGLG